MLMGSNSGECGGYAIVLPVSHLLINNFGCANRSITLYKWLFRILINVSNYRLQKRAFERECEPK